jgi:hypothetical protein
MQLEHQSIDELNAALCESCIESMSNAVARDTDYCALCDSCRDIVNEMLRRMNEATRH